MNGKEYQELAARTISAKNRADMMYHAVCGLNSEAGEVAGLFQKCLEGRELDEEHLIKELGDTLWFIAEMCTAFDFNLDDVMDENIKKLEARYPEGYFTLERSVNRNKGDI